MPGRVAGWLASRTRPRVSAHDRAAAAGFGLDGEGRLVGLGWLDGVGLGGFGPKQLEGFS